VIRIMLVLFVMLFSQTLQCADDPAHLIHTGKTVYEELSLSKMQQKLIDSANEYEKYGEVSRVAHYDIAIPKDRAEYQTMDGNGILWITAHSQLQEELPIKNVRVVMEKMGIFDLSPKFSVQTLEQNSKVAKVLGKYRYDGIYIIPVYDEMQNGILKLDYATNRQNFSVGKILQDCSPEIFPLLHINQNLQEPKPEEFFTMLKREYPITKELFPELYSKN